MLRIKKVAFYYTTVTLHFPKRGILSTMKTTKASVTYNNGGNIGMRKAYFLKIVSTALLFAFTISSISWGYPETDTLSPQHVFDAVGDPEKADIAFVEGSLRYGMRKHKNFLAKTGNHAVSKKANAQGFENIEFCFSEKEIKSKRMAYTAYILPCIVNRNPERKYYAYTIIPVSQYGLEHPNPSSVTVYTKAAYDRAVKDGKVNRRTRSKNTEAQINRLIRDYTGKDIVMADIGVRAVDHKKINGGIDTLATKEGGGIFEVSIPGLEGFEIRLVGSKTDMFIDEETGERAHAGGISTIGTGDEHKRLWIARGYWEKHRNEAIKDLMHEAEELTKWWNFTSELIEKELVKVEEKSGESAGLPPAARGRSDTIVINNVRKWIAENFDEARRLQAEYHEYAQKRYPVVTPFTLLVSAIQNFGTAKWTKGNLPIPQGSIKSGTKGRYLQYLKKEGYLKLKGRYYTLTKKGTIKAFALAVEEGKGREVVGVLTADARNNRRKILGLLAAIIDEYGSGHLYKATKETGEELKNPKAREQALMDEMNVAAVIEQAAIQAVLAILGPNGLLDNKRFRSSIDKSGMSQRLGKWPAHFTTMQEQGIEAAQIFMDLHNIVVEEEIKKVKIYGLGGSAAPHDIARGIINNFEKTGIPIEVSHKDTLTKSEILDIDKNTLVILCSFSGTTEETLNVYEQIKDRTKYFAALAKGGKKSKLHNLARGRKIELSKGMSFKLPEGTIIPFMEMPYEKGHEAYVWQPRESACLQMTATLTFLASLGLKGIGGEQFSMDDLRAEETLGLLEKWGKEFGPDVSYRNNPAKKMAFFLLYGIPYTGEGVLRDYNLWDEKKTIVILTDENTKALGHEMRTQLHERSKVATALCYDAPEFLHNLVEAKRFTAYAAEKGLDLDHTVFYYIRGLDDEQKRIGLRMDVTKELVAAGVRYAELVLEGDTPHQRAAYATNVNHRITTEMALLNGADPLPVPTMSWIKDVMAAYERGEEQDNKTGRPAFTMHVPKTRENGDIHVANCIKAMHELKTPVTLKKLADRILVQPREVIEDTIDTLKAMDLLEISGKGTTKDPHKYLLHPMLRGLTPEQINSVCAIKIEIEGERAIGLDSPGISDRAGLAQAKVIEKIQDIIHDDNQRHGAEKPHGKTLYHVFVNESVPQGQPNGMRRSFIRGINKHFQNSPDSPEKIRIIQENESLRSVIEELQQNRDNIVHVIVNDEGRLDEIAEGIKAAVLEGELGNYTQFEGALAVSRALSIADTPSRNRRLRFLHKLLTGNEFDGIIPNDPKKLAKAIKFKLPKVTVRDPWALPRLNKLLRNFVESA
jgi:hypothetical protein